MYEEVVACWEGDPLGAGVGDWVYAEVVVCWDLSGAGLLVAAVEDVVGDVLGLVDVLDDEVRVREGRGRDGLLVRPLAVDDGGHLLARVRVHRVPHLAHPRARRVHDLDALGVQELPGVGGGWGMGGVTRRRCRRGCS